MPEIRHELKIAASPDRVFQALTTAEGLRSWHTSDVTGDGAVGGEWRLRFPGRPEFRWRITASEPGRRVAWQCVQGPGDSVGTTATFEIAPNGDGRTLLVCVHAGWRGTHGNFHNCNTIWGVLMHHLRQHAETQARQPAFA